MNDWQTARTLKDLSEAYSSIYEASKGDGNLANNYPPYDEVTRGDIIAGARGEDQMGGKNKRKKVREEVDVYGIVLSHLLGEGYANTEESAEAIMANMSESWIEAILDEEREPGVKPYRPNPTHAEIQADAKRARQRHLEKAKDQKGWGDEEKFKSDWKLRVTPASTMKRKSGETETVSQRMDREKPYAKRMTGELAREYGSRAAERVTRVRKGKGEPQAVTLPRKSESSKEVIRRPKSED